MNNDNKLCCDICNVSLPNEQSQNEHLLGKKHQLMLHKIKVKETKETCGVFVRGFPNNTKLEQLQEFLSSYGEIVDGFCGEQNHFAIIQFKNPESVETLLKTNLEFGGRKLFVSRRVVKNNYVRSEDTDGGERSENIIEINDYLKTIPQFDDQIIALSQRLQPNWSLMVQKYQHLCYDLQQVLWEVFPNCVVYPFGSTITGLSFASSDVDVYVKVLATNISVSSTDDTAKAVTYVRRAKKILDRHPQKFSHVFAIPKAKTPIVKCVHNPTMISCDFNFKNMLGVCNTSLIQYYLSLDDRLRYIMILIKYWGKTHELFGRRGKFSNYSLIMLFIFYLQQGQYLIPSVKDLQDGNHTSCMQEGWDGGFNKDVKFTNNLLKECGTLNILLNFFVYYSNFDYSLNVICPYLGCAILKTDFITPEYLPKEFVTYKSKIVQEPPLKVECPICVQDPFELNHNVISSVSSKMLEEFVCLCKTAVDILSGTIDNATLYKLFTEESPQIALFKPLRTNDKCNFSFVMESNCLSYISSIANLNPEDDMDSNEKANRLRTAWYSVVNDFILKFLTTVMKFTVNLQPSDLDNKTLKLEEQTDVHDSVDSVGFICSGVYNLWETRKSISRDMKFDTNVGFWEKQVKISNYMTSLYNKEIKLTTEIIEFELNAYAKVSPIEVYVEVNKINAKKDLFSTFSMFLCKNISFWFDNYCKELDESSNK